ncbi:hypothetical protein [Vibrio sp.]|uniref:hypothetical protein n=1 Tax=Vibrio sp. TaxID=678 RepID=UPI003D0CA3C5
MTWILLAALLLQVVIAFSAQGLERALAELSAFLLVLAIGLLKSASTRKNLASSR